MTEQLTKLKTELEEYSPKQLRTLRNNINNRLQSFKLKFKEPKALQESHKLNGLEEHECKELLGVVKTAILKQKLHP